MGVQIDFNTLVEEVPFPCIAHWNKNHFVVVYKIDKNNKVYVSDPSYGLITYTRDEFIQFWIGENANENTEEGIVLILETTLHFSRLSLIQIKAKPASLFYPNTCLNIRHSLYSWQSGFWEEVYSH